MATSELAITEGGRERVLQAAALFAETFATDPVITYLLHNMSQEKRVAYLPQYFKVLVAAGALNGGTISEINGFKSCVVMMHPGKRVDNPWTMIPAGLLQMMWHVGWGPCYRMIFEFPPLTDRCKKKGLQGFIKYYYVFFVATHTSAQGQGLCPKLLKYWQDVASRDKVPLWLEATTEKSMRVYAKCGFETVEVLRLGKGKVGKDGVLPVKGDGNVKTKEELEGVPLWGMIWWPTEVKPATA